MNQLKKLKPWRKGSRDKAYDEYVHDSGVAEGEKRVLEFLEGTEP